MKLSLCISFRFIQPYPLFHGRADGDEPEWPPSPLRAFQALLNAACLRTRGKPLPPEVRRALQVIEVLRPTVVAPRATLNTTGYRAYVPHNHTDLITAAWDRGNLDASIASHRVEKDHRPHRMEIVGDDLPTVHYVYPLDATTADPAELLQAIRPSVRSIHCLGWGIDQVAADATLVEPASRALTGERWTPTARGGTRLRVHRGGSLDALAARYDRFLSRLVDGDWTPVPPLAAMDQGRYRRDSDPVPRPCAVFKLLDANDDMVAWPQAKLREIAGMVRHLAIKAMTKNPPPPRDLRGLTPQAWVESYVAGHQSEEGKRAGAAHAQFSYVPLQSIGTGHTDPGVRRVMIVAPVGDDAWLEHLARHLDGLPLESLPGTTLPEGTRLECIADVRKDGVSNAYLRSSLTRASVTPVILPGYDDHRPAKTIKLIQRALQQSGIEQPCQFEWGALSSFRNCLPAYKYDRNKRPTGYRRPDHLSGYTAVHLRLRFDQPYAGPLLLGAGRHYGLGVLAAES